MYITSEEMAALDLNCEYFGLSRLQLMENAGMALAQEVFKEVPERKIAVFAGLGNNGGDAFVASRILSEKYGVKIYLLGRAKDIKTDIARRNFELARLAGVKVVEVRDSSELTEDESDCIIDAMLGTGVRGKLREPYSSAVDVINESDALKIAVDVPTGLNPDTGEYSKAVKADLTVTFHKAKPGLLKAKEVVGRLVVKSIGIPPEFERLSGPGDVKLTFRRDPEGHKGTHGRVLVAGGGPYTGAPVLASMAALRAGADLVFLAVPESIRDTVSAYSPELIVRSLDDLNFKFDVAVVGMGMEEDVAIEFVKKLQKRECRKIVLDASAIPAVEECNSKSCEVIITPHRGELRKYFGEVDVVELAREVNATVLLKGQTDVITDGERIKVNRTGNAGMTVGGTGDVLAGVCGAFFASSGAFRAAVSSAFVTGLAGDLSFEQRGYCLTASDVIDRIPEAIKKCLEFS